jgi:hypothetical protein
MGLRALAALCRCGRSSAQHPPHDGRRIRLARRGEVIGLSEPVHNLAQGRRPPLLARKNRTLAYWARLSARFGLLHLSVEADWRLPPTRQRIGLCGRPLSPGGGRCSPSIRAT